MWAPTIPFPSSDGLWLEAIHVECLKWSSLAYIISTAFLQCWREMSDTSAWKIFLFSFHWWSPIFLSRKENSWKLSATSVWTLMNMDRKRSCLCTLNSLVAHSLKSGNSQGISKILKKAVACLLAEIIGKAVGRGNGLVGTGPTWAWVRP